MYGNPRPGDCVWGWAFTRPAENWQYRLLRLTPTRQRATNGSLKVRIETRWRAKSGPERSGPLSNVPPSVGKALCYHRARKTASDYEVVDQLAYGTQCNFLRATHSQEGLNDRIRTLLLLMQAASHILRQSSWTNDRAIETGPSCCTKA